MKELLAAVETYRSPGEEASEPRIELNPIGLEDGITENNSNVALSDGDLTTVVEILLIRLQFDGGRRLWRRISWTFLCRNLSWC